MMSPETVAASVELKRSVPDPLAEFGQNFRRQLLKELQNGSFFLGTGRFGQVRFAMAADPRFFGHHMAAIPAPHHNPPPAGRILAKASRCLRRAGTLAERERFEPSAQFDPHTAFPGLVEFRSPPPNPLLILTRSLTIRV